MIDLTPSAQRVGVDAPVVIVGGGLAGLTCARHLEPPCEIYERAAQVGGVASSTKYRGFTFDCTGHWLHLRDEGIKRLVSELFEDEELLNVERRAQIHSHGVKTPYPFQSNTHGLPESVKMACLLGYFEAREREARGGFPPPQSLEDFARQRMGDGITEHFMIPYNTKLWTVPPSEMGHAWTQRFVPLPTPEEILRGALTPTGGQGLGYNASFLYPKRGGIAALAERLRRSVVNPIHLGMEIVRIDAERRTVRLGSGEHRPFSALVSTMPLPDLIACIEDTPETVIAAATRLRATSVTYWNVGVAGANHPHDAHWIYFPEPDVPFYRAGSPSAAVPSLAPCGHRAYYVEVSHRRGSTCHVTDDAIVGGMRRVGLLKPNEEPLFVERRLIDCAYVIMDHAYGSARKTVLDWLDTQRIWSVGRYGAWTYDSMEGAMAQGRNAAHQVNRWASSAG